MSTPGERIKMARQNAGLTQKQLADLMRKSVSMISNLETGASVNPTPETLYLLADVLDCNPRWLGIGQGEMYGKEKNVSNIARKAAAESILQMLEGLPDHRRKEMIKVIEKVYDAEQRIKALLNPDTPDE